MTIEVSGLTKDYGDLRALSDVSFAVDRGQVFGYLGPNGAGKSTTVRLLLGLHEPTAGEIRVAGIDVRRDPVAAREQIGYVPEVNALYDSLTPWEHLLFVGRVRQLPRVQLEDRARALLEAFDLGDRADETIRSFSKGMRQKVALSLAFLHRPAVLVLDEPLAGLDVTAAMVLKSVIRGFAARGSAVLYCSHVLDVVERVCDRASILNKGRIVAQGTLEELRETTRGTTLDEVFQTVASDQDPEMRAGQLLQALDS